MPNISSICFAVHLACLLEDLCMSASKAFPPPDILNLVPKLVNSGKNFATDINLDVTVEYLSMTLP